MKGSCSTLSSKTIANFLYLPILVLIQWGCDRAKMDSDGSTIVIKTPSLPISSMSRKSEISSLSTSPIVSTGFDGTAPINCYALMVAGPEPILQRNYCTINGSSVSKIPVGMWLGGVQAGGTLSMPGIPAGEDREVRLIGFHAKDGACIDFKKNGLPKGFISDPYILAESTRVKMPPGATVTLEMEATFDVNKTLADCTGPDFSEVGGGDPNRNPNPTPTNLIAMKFDFPKNSFVRGACARIELRLMNDYGNIGMLPSDVSFKLSQVYKDISNNLSQPVFQIYETLTECLNPPAAAKINSIFKANTDRAEVYVKVSNATNMNKLTLMPEVVSAPTNLNPKSLINDYSLFYPTQSTFQINGPDRILPELCYSYDVRSVLFNNSPGTSTSIKLTATTGLNVYSSWSECMAGSPASMITLTSGAGVNLPFYVKMNSTAILPSIEATDGNSTQGVISAIQRIDMGNGTPAPFRVELIGNNQIMRNSCGWGSFIQLRIVNDKGVLVPVPSSGLNCTLNNPITTIPIEVYSESTCSPSGIRALGTAFSLPVGTITNNFFIKSTGNGLGAGQLDLECSSLVQTKSSFFFQVQ